MKKYLAMLCALMMLTVLPSCGDSQESSSKPSSSASESDTEENTTEESTIEPVTEKPTEKEIVLDSEWECDYLTIAKSSEWEEKVEIEDDEIIVTWIGDGETLCHRIWFRIEIPSDNGKMSEEDLQKNILS